MTRCEICLRDHSADRTEYLVREYLDLNKARFNPLFGRNAARCQSEVAKTLLARGISEISNIFGPIQIRVA